MFQLKLSAALVATPTGAVARVTDLTDWSQAVSVRGTWALFLAGVQLGSVQNQDGAVLIGAYDAHAFQSGDNPAGTVDVPLPADGMFRFQAVAVPLVLSSNEFALATTGRMYYRLDTSKFVYKTNAGTSQVITSWNDVLDAAGTDNGEPAEKLNLLDKSGQAYVLSATELRAALGKLNLRYLEAPNRQRTLLQHEYSQIDLLISGAERQLELGLYADVSTTLSAATRLLGACLPGYAQSLPALLQGDCGCV